MRDIHVGKRGSEAASEEQLDKLRKTVRFEQEASSAASSSDPVLPLEYPASVRHKICWGPYLCRSQVMLMMTHNFCVGCVLRDGWTKESLHQRSVGLVSKRRCWRSQEK